MTVQILDYAALSITLYQPVFPTTSSTVSGSSIKFLPPPGPIPYFPPDCTCQRRFSLSLHPLLTPLSRPVAVIFSTWTALPPAGRHCSSALLSYAVCGIPRSSLRKPCLPPLSSCPPCRPLPVPRSLLAPGFSRTGVPSSLCLPPSNSRPLPLPAGLYQRPSLLPVPGGGVVLSLPCPLCFHLSIPVLHALPWCRLNLNSYLVSFCVVP